MRLTAYAVSTRIRRYCQLMFGTAVLSAVMTPVARAQQAVVPLAEMNHTAWTYADSIMLGGATQIVESRDGYLWLSSTRGLIRFDGVRFTQLDSNNATALRTTRTGPFLPRMVDHNGTLWATRPDGALITYRDGRFNVLSQPEPGKTAQVVEDAKGNVWVWTLGASGMRRVNASEQLELVPLPFNAPTAVMSVISDHADGLWIGTKPLALWHKSGGAWSQLAAPASAESGSAIPQLQSRDGSLWVTFGGELYRFASNRWHKVVLPGKPEFPIYAKQVVEDAQGSIWIAATDEGILRWSNGNFESFGLSDGLSGADGLAVYVNRVGVAWIATGAGIDRLRTSALIAMPDNPLFPLSSTDRIVQDFAGFAWAVGDGGRSLARLERGLIRGTGKTLVERVRLPANARNGVQLLAAARLGGAWIAPYSGGLARVTANGFETIGDRIGVPRGRLWNMLEARDSSLWLAELWGGVGRVVRGRYEALQIPELARAPISSFAEDAAGHVWISIDNQPKVVEMSANRLVRQFGTESGLRDTILRLVVEHSDTLWGIGTRSLVRIAGGHATTITVPAITFIRGTSPRTRAQGVPSLGAFIAGERLWVVGEGGIAHFSVSQLHRAADDSTNTVEAEIVSALDGIRAPAARASTLDPVSRLNDGRFVIRTPVGYAILDPARLPAVRPHARALIEAVTAAGHNVSMDSLVVAPNSERVEIRITATTDLFPERVQLEHRLDGVEDAWTATGASRVATYTQLRPGHYTFRARARRVGADSAGAETHIEFQVAPTWYQTRWFRGFALLLLVAGGPFAAYAAVHARSREREAQLQARFDAALAERTRVARELHDTLLQGFSGIALQLQAALLSMEKSPEQTAERLTRTLTLADATLLDARRTIWDMRMPELEHSDLAAALEASARNAVVDTPITIHWRLRGHRRRLSPLLESTALRIGREAVTNAVRHAHPNSIEIDLAYGDAAVELCVRDDGSGFVRDSVENAPSHGHWGVSGMRERAASVGGSLEMFGAPGGGTAVSLRIPIETIRLRAATAPDVHNI